MEMIPLALVLLTGYLKVELCGSVFLVIWPQHEKFRSRKKFHLNLRNDQNKESNL